MKAITLLALPLLLCVHASEATPLDDYLNSEETVYKWRDTGYKVDKLLFGGTASVLNVTSLEWLSKEKAYSPNGATWSHQVAVVVPSKLTVKTVGMAVMTGGCIGQKYPGESDEYLEIADNIAQRTGGIAVVIYQIPNCPVIFPSDPAKKERGEDSLIAWAWRQFLVDPQHDPEWLPRLPMAKAGMQCMRAVEEYAKATLDIDIEGWVVSGASKRGWTTWAVGMATCENCPNILGIAPLVPIVPDLVKEVHRQWQSYDGFTFAFSDYTAVNITQDLDSEEFQNAMKIVDPVYYGERLSRLPKVVVLSSDDEL